MKTFYVYIMGSKSGTLYVGMTSNIKKRIYEHKNHLMPGFTDKYNIDKLLYVETKGEASSAINREKQIDSINSAWNDLSEDWYN